MQLFKDAADLKASGYLFRITDNGGATYDRITVTFCDGDYILCTESTICAHGERGDVQVDSDDVEAGTARDLRWIDLDPYLQNRIIADLNDGFSNYIESAPAAATRDEARDWGGIWNEYGDDRTPIYIRDGKFYIRDDEMMGYSEDGEPGPFDSFRDAVFHMLPQDYDLSGPEYHTTVDLWDETGGPSEPWDCEADPATPYEVKAIQADPDYKWHDIGEATDLDAARAMGAAWREANPDLSPKCRIAAGHKNNRSFETIG